MLPKKLLSQYVCLPALSMGLLLSALVSPSVLLSTGVHASDTEVNVYSSRKEALILPLLNKFSHKTGITVNLLTGKDDALLSRLALEGQSSPADILITADVARLHRAKQNALLQPMQSLKLAQAIKPEWRDPDNQWFAITSRARPIIYALGRVDPATVTRYEDLASSEWQGRLCMRSSSNVYNQSLVASKLLIDGDAKTAAWLDGLVKNFVRPPAGGDTDQIKAVAAGICDVTMANTYYLGRLANSSKAADLEVASKVGVIWPNQSDRGAHFNVSGIAMTASAKNPAAAKALMEYMISKEAQVWYAEANNEYPVVSGVPVAQVLQNFGTGKADTANLFLLGELNLEAVRLMDKAGWR